MLSNCQDLVYWVILRTISYLALDLKRFFQVVSNVLTVNHNISRRKNFLHSQTFKSCWFSCSINSKKYKRLSCVDTKRNTVDSFDDFLLIRLFFEQIVFIGLLFITELSCDKILLEINNQKWWISLSIS